MLTPRTEHKSIHTTTDNKITMTVINLTLCLYSTRLTTVLPCTLLTFLHVSFCYCKLTDTKNKFGRKMFELIQHLSPDKQCTVLVCKSATLNTEHTAVRHRSTVCLCTASTNVHTHVRPVLLHLRVCLWSTRKAYGGMEAQFSTEVVSCMPWPICLTRRILRVSTELR
jgi:hypothetical protein